MNHRIISHVRAFASSTLLTGLGLLAFSVPAAAVPTIDVTVNHLAPSVSVNTPPKGFTSTYSVSVKNNGPDVSQFLFFGYAVAKDLANVTVDTAAYDSSTGATCSPILSLLFTLRCEVGAIAAGATKQFTVTFKAPAVGNTLRLGWAGDVNSLLRPPPPTELGFDDVTLITDTVAQKASGFTTSLTPAGGTFYTGVNTGGPAYVGGVATYADPFTTTIVVPPITTPTTATVAEQTLLSSCSPLYGQCFESALSIPDTQFPTTPLIVYLRIDASRLKPGANIANAVIYYEHNPGDGLVAVPNCATGLPALGQPCIEARKRYPSTSATDWRGDWEFKIQARDNGRFNT